jgi:uncharacterized protein YyaL (SSP411 family)
MAEKTLTQMRSGGIHDHIGFGFHRYSTDGQWLVPHFEKMLYDQALLTMAYTEAFQATGKKFYARTVREILTYILRDMTSREGGFYSAEDADSEGVEGKFYLWTLPQIQSVIGLKEIEAFRKIYNLEEDGNFKLQEAEQPVGSNILRLKKTLPAHLEDYAFVVWGFLELYQTTFKTIYLQEAIRLNDLMIKHFWDSQNGGLFMTADDGEKLLIRNKEICDGAIPSDNSVAALNLLRLGHMTGRQHYLQKAERIGKAFAGAVNRYPPGHAHLMMALDYALNPNYEVVIAGRRGANDTRAMLTALRKPFLPGKVVVVRPSDKKEAAAIIRLAPYTEYMVPKDGKATAYVCTNFICKLPTTDISQMLANLRVEKK